MCLGKSTRQNARAGQNQYQYNGIERNEDLGLNWDLAAFRSYDAAIGRWMQVDPRAEKYYGMTPYNGMGNNPISIADPLGDTLRIQTSAGDMNDSGGNAIVNDGGEVIVGNGNTSIVYTPGMAPVDDNENRFVNVVIKALNWIYDNIGEDAINEIVTSSETSFVTLFKKTLKGGFTPKSYFDTNDDGKGGAYTMFAPEAGAYFYVNAPQAPTLLHRWFGDWGYRSPIEILNHELEHNRSYFHNPAQHFRDSGTPDPNYTNLEEKQSMDVENSAARRLFGNKAVIRRFHRGEYAKAKNGIYPLNH